MSVKRDAIRKSASLHDVFTPGKVPMFKQLKTKINFPKTMTLPAPSSSRYGSNSFDIGISFVIKLSSLIGDNSSPGDNWRRLGTHPGIVSLLIRCSYDGNRTPLLPN